MALGSCFFLGFWLLAFGIWLGSLLSLCSRLLARGVRDLAWLVALLGFWLVSFGIWLGSWLSSAFGSWLGSWLSLLSQLLDLAWFLALASFSAFVAFGSNVHSDPHC